MVSLVGVACDQPTVCTANYVYGLAIHVSDRATQISLVDNQTIVVASEGAFADTAVAFAGVFNAAGERPGVYTVTAERSGYQKWSQGNVRVRADDCHVQPVDLHARLDASP
jgi:hypothetical protein